MFFSNIQDYICLYLPVELFICNIGDQKTNRDSLKSIISWSLVYHQLCFPWNCARLLLHCLFVQTILHGFTTTRWKGMWMKESLSKSHWSRWNDPSFPAEKKNTAPPQEKKQRLHLEHALEISVSSSPPKKSGLVGGVSFSIVAEVSGVIVSLNSQGVHVTSCMSWILKSYTKLLLMVQNSADHHFEVGSWNPII